MAARRNRPAAGQGDGDARFAAIAQAYAADPRVSYGRLFSAMGLKVDGRIFAMAVEGDLVVKLPKARVDGLVAGGAAGRFDPGHGRVMKEWARFAPGQADWEGLVREACDYVGGIAPPARKKASTARPGGRRRAG